MLFDIFQTVNRHAPEVEITASDIDGKVLEHAKKGIYGVYSIHDLPSSYVKTYFTVKKTRLGDEYKISEDIKKKVNFMEEDLTRGHKGNKIYDVIFCRNFLIYLNTKSQTRVLKTIADHLIPGGLLIIGKTEMILDSKSDLFTLVDPKHHFYRKK